MHFPVGLKGESKTEIVVPFCPDAQIPGLQGAILRESSHNSSWKKNLA